MSAATGPVPAPGSSRVATSLVLSLAAHLLVLGWLSSVQLRGAPRAPERYLEVESWPEPAAPALSEPPASPPPAAAGRPAGPAGPAPRPAATAAAPAPPRPQGMLRALSTAGLGARDLAQVAGEPDALRDLAPAADHPDLATAGGAALGRRSAAAGAAAGAARLGEPGAMGGSRGVVLPGDLGGGGLGAVIGAGGGESGAGVDPQGLAGFVRERVPGIRACYAAELLRDPGLRGRIRIGFVVREDGALDDVRLLEDGVGSVTLTRCVVRLVRTWRTPFRPAGAVPVEYPFSFSVDGR